MSSPSNRIPNDLTSNDGFGAYVITPKVAQSTISVDPVTRIEGHLRIEVGVEETAGQLRVANARSTGTLFRGFEVVLNQRPPWDAIPITQRICGVCPVSHAHAATLTLENALGINAPTNARLLRNLALAANFIQSHILHFYHLCVVDYMAGPAMAPWEPSWDADRRMDSTTTDTLLQHYLQALEMRRKAHELGAIIVGKLPHAAAYLPGGMTGELTQQNIDDMHTLLDALQPFIQDTYVPDVQLLGSFYSDYFQIGEGCRNLLSFGEFRQDDTGQQMLFQRGRLMDGSPTVLPVDVNQITEDVTWSWYENRTNGLHPSSGETAAEYPKNNRAYSWLKAPRYEDEPYETGPLARMLINGEYLGGISTMDRHVSRSEETMKLALEMRNWLNLLVVGQPTFIPTAQPETADAEGLVEAPRGALGHWLSVRNQEISNYQVVTPTCWNASPRDSRHVHGPIEQALIGTVVADRDQPVELLRIVHSFDPCLACAVHVVDANNTPGVKIQNKWDPQSR